MTISGSETTHTTVAAATGDPSGDAGAENFAQWIIRIAYGCAWIMKPERVRVVPHIWWRGFRHYLTPRAHRSLPDTRNALDFGEGFVGICDTLTPEIVMETYAKGLYALSHVGPLKWHFPPLRSVLFFDETHLEKNLRRLLRQGKFTVTFDRDFDAVIDACAAPRPGRRHLTWIDDTQKECFKALHRQGHAHSVEVWDANGELAGGLYGLAVGRVFATESQFFRKRDASKVGFAVLNQHLQHWGFVLNDGKNETPHLKQTGFTQCPGRNLHPHHGRACFPAPQGGPLAGRPGARCHRVDTRRDVGFHPRYGACILTETAGWRWPGRASGIDSPSYIYDNSDFKL